MHHHEYKDKVLVLANQSRSDSANPDIFDSVLMGFWLQLKHEVVME